jgi:transketolase N-terminal domain/subunit
MKQETSTPYADPVPANRVYPYGARHTVEMIGDLSRRAYEYRAQVLDMVYERKSGHLGGAFSIAEILTALYFHQLRIDPENPQWPDRDRLVFSKGHACAMLYTVLAHRGFFPVEELSTFRSLNSRLQGHPEPARTTRPRRGYRRRHGVGRAPGRVASQDLRDSRRRGTG